MLKLSFEDFRSEIAKRQPDIVGVTSSTLTYNTAMKLVKIAKEACPNCITVAGGAHVTFWDDKALEECPELDVVVRRKANTRFWSWLRGLKQAKASMTSSGQPAEKTEKSSETPIDPTLKI